MWKLRVSRSFERAIRQIPREYQRRIVAWHDEHAEGISDPANLDKVVWLTKDKVFGRIRFGRYRLGLMLDRKNQLIVLRYVGARGDFYKRFPAGDS
uniref:mRNA-degrading endonuclease RelE, toxin component of the RelBE toxin-antitoxin system n=2 Tax=unclassified Candidatus Kentrum TaxID=2643149 RepID=A0A450YVI0_9GAMM|nr:MAG: mRNA-degrading endonuclease RelE, toxin component of the RelBE toxin-antitoxin system [Candidatus Kentron sp. SD]VFK45532.1 MAG: mRNA-degrading endonuclease RelE, toxin component of the RelBE toxin-antitoxin system [Candidatus Kentron sp. SD]VFK66587.1 MAG: mRNA-degrading endonuclease RelE, toxin component of the RelBE toxin-antitoxin system [Candidatus Kentron sp. UNK]VFK69924.1 MAG: mRNA-degrading endonuclease RelE, toxin component of the RelBE toxin-antitoxin system [Candidatus Kentro